MSNSRQKPQKKRCIDDFTPAPKKPPENVNDNCNIEASTQNENFKKTRRSFSNNDKLMILQKSDIQPIKSVLNEFNLDVRVFRRWKKDRKNIEEMCTKKSASHQKKNKRPGSKQMEDMLYDWYLNARESGIPVSGMMLQAQALQINKELNGDVLFTASQGWLARWKNRKGIKSLRIEGETTSEDDPEPPNDESTNPYLTHFSIMNYLEQWGRLFEKD